MGVKQNVRLLNTLIIEQCGFKVLWFNYSRRIMQWCFKEDQQEIRAVIGMIIEQSDCRAETLKRESGTSTVKP